jgi:hypothetical protein
MESPLRMISQKELVLSHQKGSFKKAKITPVYNEPATVVTELKAKVDVPAESSQIEAVNEGNQ